MRNTAKKPDYGDISMKRTGWSGLTLNTITKTSWLFLGLNLTDFMLTVIILRLGIGTEGNPLLVVMPLWAMGILKLGIAFVVVVVLGHRVGIMRALCVGMGIVVLWNLTVFVVGSIQ